MLTNSIFISDFTDPRFTEAFKRYFEEIEVNVTDWGKLFSEMNSDTDAENHAYLLLSDMGDTVGFIMFCTMTAKSLFFDTEFLFIRELWIKKEYRTLRLGTQLLSLAEEYSRALGIGAAVLTTDTAPDFYLKNGYVKAETVKAKNGDDTFIKIFSRLI